MTDRIFSNDELDDLRSTSKRVTNPRARWLEKPGHRQRNYEVVSEAGDDRTFRVYQRQSLHDEKDFSCGLALILHGGKPLSLVRYNGASHRHGSIRYRCHIHSATAEAVAAGRKVDNHAKETDRY